MRRLRIFLLVVGIALIAYAYVDQREYVDEPDAFGEFAETIQEISLEPEATTLIVFGSSGADTDEQRGLAELMGRLEVDAVVHTGDLATPQSTEEALDAQFAAVYPSSITARFYPVPGPEEYAAENARPYLEYFDLPKQALAPADNERYYSVDIGTIHLVALDSNRPLDEASFSRTDDMADWLDQDLAGVPPDMVTIIILHHSPFTSESVHGPDRRVRNKLVSIFDQYAVDFVVSGHTHNYQRTCPLNFTASAETCASPGTLYLVTGGGGAPLHGFRSPREPFIAARTKAHHFLLFEVTDEGLIRLRAIDDTGTVIDDVTLRKRS